MQFSHKHSVRDLDLAAVVAEFEVLPGTPFDVINVQLLMLFWRGGGGRTDGDEDIYENPGLYYDGNDGDDGYGDDEYGMFFDEDIIPVSLRVI